LSRLLKAQKLLPLMKILLLTCSYLIVGSIVYIVVVLQEDKFIFIIIRKPNNQV
jgi:hypothetical protein